MREITIWRDAPIVDNMVSASVMLDDNPSRHTVAINLTDANTSITVFSVALQGSADNAPPFSNSIVDASATWHTVYTYNFDATDITNLYAMFSVTDTPQQRIRFKVTTSTGESAGDLITLKYVQGEN